jgi:hypothetical protein
VVGDGFVCHAGRMGADEAEILAFAPEVVAAADREA